MFWARKRFSILIVAWTLLSLASLLTGTVFAAHIGRIQDPGALSATYAATVDILSAPLSDPDALALFAVGEEAFKVLDPALFTGYSVKDQAEAAPFDATRTVRYGHASPWHLIDLLAVMKHHGFNPSLSVESRVSSYVHHYEWGPLSEEDIFTPIDENRAIIYVMEYDAVFEFDRADGVEAFDAFIRRYAQKERGQEDRFDLIGDSWYVPLYSSADAHGGYDALKEVRVSYGDHYFVNYVVDEVADDIAQMLQTLVGEGYSVTTNDLWVNGVFFEYVGGTRD